MRLLKPQRLIAVESRERVRLDKLSVIFFDETGRCEGLLKE
jgi:hypothetical protein